MARSTVNVNVETNNKDTAEYIFKTVNLRPFIAIENQIQDTDTKYVIKWKFTLSTTLTIPRNCILEFDGGQIIGTGTLVSSNNDTKIVNLYDYNVIGNGVTLSGDFQKFTGEYVNV